MIIPQFPYLSWDRKSEKKISKPLLWGWALWTLTSFSRIGRQPHPEENAELHAVFLRCLTQVTIFEWCPKQLGDPIWVKSQFIVISHSHRISYDIMHSFSPSSPTPDFKTKQKGPQIVHQCSVSQVFFQWDGKCCNADKDTLFLGGDPRKEKTEEHNSVALGIQNSPRFLICFPIYLLFWGVISFLPGKQWRLVATLMLSPDFSLREWATRPLDPVSLISLCHCG